MGGFGWGVETRREDKRVVVVVVVCVCVCVVVVVTMAKRIVLWDATVCLSAYPTLDSKRSRD